MNNDITTLTASQPHMLVLMRFLGTNLVMFRERFVHECLTYTILSLIIIILLCGSRTETIQLVWNTNAKYTFITTKLTKSGCKTLNETRRNPKKLSSHGLCNIHARS